MRLDYDYLTDSLYIHLSDRPAADSDEVAEGVVLDYDEHGWVVGIDLQHASKKFDLRQLLVKRLPVTEFLASG